MCISVLEPVPKVLPTPSIIQRLRELLLEEREKAHFYNRFKATIAILLLQRASESWHSSTKQPILNYALRGMLLTASHSATKMLQQLHSFFCSEEKNPLELQMKEKVDRTRMLESQVQQLQKVHFWVVCHAISEISCDIRSCSDVVTPRLGLVPALIHLYYTLKIDHEKLPNEELEQFGGRYHAETFLNGPPTNQQTLLCSGWPSWTMNHRRDKILSQRRHCKAARDLKLSLSWRLCETEYRLDTEFVHYLLTEEEQHLDGAEKSVHQPLTMQYRGTMHYKHLLTRLQEELKRQLCTHLRTADLHFAIIQSTNEVFNQTIHSKQFLSFDGIPETKHVELFLDDVMVRYSAIRSVPQPM